MKYNIDLENLHDFIELIEDLAFFKDLDGKYTHCNEAFLNYIQKSREEVIGKNIFDLHSPEFALKTQEDDSSEFEAVFKHEDGFNDYFQTTKQVIQDKDGNSLGIFYIAKDTTLKKQYEFIYEDNQSMLEYIATNDNLKDILDKIVEFAEKRNMDSKCSILILNESKENLLSGSAPSLPDFYNDAINGVAVGEKIGSCGSAAFKQERVIVENIDTHENWQPFLGLTQQANLHACWSEPIFSSKDEILGTFAIYNNEPKTPSDFALKLISSYAHIASVAIEKENNTKALRERENKIQELNKTLEEKVEKRTDELAQTVSSLQETQKKLIESEKLASLSGLVAGVAHEINTPIGLGITSMSHFVSETQKIKNLYEVEDMGQEDFEYYLQTSDKLAQVTYENLKRAAELVKSFKQISVDQTSEQQREFNLRDYIEETLLSLHNRLKKTKIKVEINCPDSLSVNSYPGAYSQIITNLIMNSLIHAYAQNDSGTIRLNLQIKDSQLEFIYEDDGKGISQENLKKVFDPFFTTNRAEGGSGLGLNIIYNIVSGQLGGNIECQSELTKGVKFIMNIPINKEEL